ncbi:MAG: ArsR/SmtB family transcription factor [Thermogutta sp.]
MKEFMSIVKAMADEKRLRILMFLRSGELCVCQLIDLLEPAPPIVSKHIAILYQAGLVESRKEGRWVYYRLAGEGASPHARSAIAWLCSCLENAPTIIRGKEKVQAVRAANPKDLCCHYRR